MCHIMHYRTAAGNISCEKFREFHSIAALRESYCFSEMFVQSMHNTM